MTQISTDLTFLLLHAGTPSAVGNCGARSKRNRSIRPEKTLPLDIRKLPKPCGFSIFTRSQARIDNALQAISAKRKLNLQSEEGGLGCPILACLFCNYTSKHKQVNSVLWLLDFPLEEAVFNRFTGTSFSFVNFRESSFVHVPRGEDVDVFPLNFTGTPSTNKLREVKRRDDGKLRFGVSVFPSRGNKRTGNFINLYKFVKSNLINSYEFVRIVEFGVGE